MGLGSGINAFRARAERNGTVGGGGAVGGTGTGISGPWEAEKKKKKKKPPGCGTRRLLSTRGSEVS